VKKLAGKVQAMIRMIFWFALVGWSAGWVTGRAMKCPSHSQWTDAFVGILGGVAAGYAVRSWETWNWGFLLAEIVAAAGAVLLTWGAHRVKHLLMHRNHPAH
jgi:uncharacterized membrane protein YeaQ/YmgE (transglycosylase-associated protein family)